MRIEGPHRKNRCYLHPLVYSTFQLEYRSKSQHITAFREPLDRYTETAQGLEECRVLELNPVSLATRVLAVTFKTDRATVLNVTDMHAEASAVLNYSRFCKNKAYRWAMPPQKSISSPASSVSATETVLPTPDLPFSKSLRQVAQMSVDVVPDDNDVFSQSTVLNHSAALGSPEESKTQQAEVPSISVASTVGVDDASPTPHSRHNATPIVRPPPPRIFLRRENAEKSTRVTAPGTEPRSSHRQAAAKGLNISGLPLPEITTNTIVEQGYIEDKPSKEDENDALPELASPRRLNFGNSEKAPVSPAWQSMESPKSNQYSPRGKRQSIHCFTSQPNLEVPSPLGPKFRRFEPTPNHGIHSRNLSLFFPQPGSTPPPKSTSPGLIPSPEFGETTLIPSSDSSNEKKVFGGAGTWSFGQARPEAGGSVGLLTPDVKRSKRRGHHVSA